MGLRRTSIAAIALIGCSVAVGCGTSRTVIYPFNGAKQSYINGCKAQVAKEPGLSAALRGALEANCADPNPAAVTKAATESVTQACQAALTGSTPGLSAAVKNQLGSICAAAKSPTNASSAAAQACQQVIKSTVPKALQQRALASCPKP